MAFGIPEQTIEEIKARTDLADLIAGYGIQVKRAGGSYKACCPFHHEKTPSFNINPERGFYHCFGCGESGDAIKFVMRYEGLPFIDAAKKLAAAANITIEEKADPQARVRKRLFELHAELAAFYQRCLKSAKEASRARAYLKSRDLSDEIIDRFQIGYAPQSVDAMLKWAAKHHFTMEELAAASVMRPPRQPGRSPYSPFAGRLMFSIRDRSGRVIAFSGRTLETDKAKMRGGKYVNSYDSPIFKKSNVLYALDQAAIRISGAKPIREAIVCEGQIDVIRCHAHGFDRAVASQGTSFTKEHVQILQKVADAAILVFDGDAAGRKAAIRTGSEMLEAGLMVRVARLPAGEDPDSLLRTKGSEAFQACLDAAESIVAFQVRNALEAEQHPESYDAIARAANGVLDLVKCSSSAVMRASLLREASALLKIPVSALEADFEKRAAAADSSRRMQATHAGGGGASERETGAFGEEGGSGCTEPGNERGTPNEDAAAHADGSTEDASDPSCNPPPKLEMEFMEFLFNTERDGQMVDLLEAHAPPELFAHPVTRGFVESYVRETRGEADAVANLAKRLPDGLRRFLEDVFGSVGRANVSQQSPMENFMMMMKSLWASALKRRHDSIRSFGQDALRLKLMTASKTMRNGKWDAVVKKMDPDILK